MILVGNQRGGASDLANHLMKTENENVRVHELRGFIGNDLHSAFRESYAISRGTNCKQHLFSLSLNPPKEADVSDEDFEDAVERAEKRLGLDGQARAIVFHEKLGQDGELRRHAHAVWCRIDTEEMKAIQLSYSKTKLNEVAKELYLEHGWEIPRGFANRTERDPMNFTLEEWQQSKRTGRDPKAVKAIFQDAWAISDSRDAFAAAIKEHGYILAEGDRRGFVGVDYQGEKFAVARAIGIKTKQVRERLGELEGLPDVEKAQEQAAAMIAKRLEEIKEEQTAIHERMQNAIAEEQEQSREAQASEQMRLEADHNERAQAEEAERQERFRKGFMGLWDRFTGRHKNTLLQNEFEAAQARERDVQEKQWLDNEHQREARQFEEHSNRVQKHHEGIDQELTQDIGTLQHEAQDDRRQQIDQLQEQMAQMREQNHSRDGPEFER